MISQIVNIYTLPLDFQTELESHKPYTEKSWDSKAGNLVEIREEIKRQLIFNQKNKCCYCGLELGETSRVEIEHIAPKAGRQGNFPQFSYYKYNLAAICQFCNSSSKKGEFNPITKESPLYRRCEFSIVHPYLNDPAQYYDFKRNSLQIVISAKEGVNKSKALKSIEIFGLSEEAHANARAKQYYWEKRKSKYNFTDAIIDRIKGIVLFKRS